MKKLMTADENNSEYSLLKQVPMVLRARSYRLYTEGGRRLIDLWLNGGAAILGHTPPNFLRELKNTASRGLYAPFPHFSETRFLKALTRLFPGHCFRLYAAPPPELIALFNTGAVKLWRPFENASDIVSDIMSGLMPGIMPGIIPVLPGIQGWRGELPFGLCVVASESESLMEILPPGDILSPVLLAVAARGIYDILSSPRRAKPALPRTAKVSRQKTGWRHGGIYLYLKEKPAFEKYAALFHKFLEAGFLLPPVPCQPLILPGELSAGEDAKLAAALALPE
jgi:hypothetical protein